jgi:serine/threonine protein kinase/tetratricopeptide (TPR) repeat protein
MALATGDRLGRYEILAPLGAGGMGEVYRARDATLDREVAIKVLPETVAQDPDRLERFEREARAVARLSHPNILEIHDFGHEGELAYAVTELLEGESLRDRLGSAPLDWRAAARIGADIADGLVAAHERAVVHRDLKPGNVFLTADDRVKILDFGLARVTESATPEAATEALDSTITRQGAVLGTAGYMSPEQVRGRPADHRSDIFSLGCVLYEMVAGRRAFERDTGADTMAAILTEQPEDLSVSGVELPPDLERAIQRCLEKKAEQRFQSAADLAYVLRAVVTDSGAKPELRTVRPKRRLARLIPVALAALIAAISLLVWIQREEEPPPTTEVSEFNPNRVVVAVFDNRTGDPALDSLGLQTSDAITNLLHQVEGVDVAVNPLSSMAGSASLEQPAADSLTRLAEATLSGLVVTGSYHLRGSELELQARIMDPRQIEVLQTFDPERASRADPSPAVEVVRQRVAGVLAAHVDGLLPFGTTRPMPLTAFQEYRRAVEISVTDYPLAVSHLERALEIDPGFFSARVLLVRFSLYVRNHPEAEAQLALLSGELPRITPYEQAEVRDCRAQLEGRSLDMLSAARELVRLAPESLWARLGLGYRALWTNRPREAVATLEGFSFDWSPGNAYYAPQPFILLGMAYHMLGDYEAKLHLARESLERFPDVTVFYGQQGDALAAMGRFDELEEIVDECFTIPARVGTAGSNLGFTARELRAHGHRVQSIELAERVIAWCRNRPDQDSRTARNTLAHALVAAERWEEARTVFEGLAREFPDRLSNRKWVGVLAARTGDRAEAERIAEGLRTLDGSYLYGRHTYARACIAAQLGERERAMELLRDAFSQGFKFSVGLHSGMDLEPLWDFPPFQELIEPKG